jgi:hypothetical protein
VVWDKMAAMEMERNGQVAGVTWDICAAPPMLCASGICPAFLVFAQSLRKVTGLAGVGRLTQPQPPGYEVPAPG